MAISPNHLPLDSTTQQQTINYHLLTVQAAMIDQIAQVTCGTLVLDEVLHSIALQLHDTLQVSGCLILQASECQPMAASLSVETAQQDGRGVSAEHFYSLCSELCQYYHSFLAQGKPLMMPGTEPRLPPALQDRATECNVGAILIVPLLHRQSYIGGITLYQCGKEREWKPQEIAFLQAIAHHCAIALTLVELEERYQTELKKRQECESALKESQRQLLSTESVQARDLLQQVNEALENRVAERTAALREVNQTLRAEIVERKRTEEQLRASEERFRQAVVNAPFPIMIHAEDGQILQINQVWTELTGYAIYEIPTIAEWTQKACPERKEIVRSLIAQSYDRNYRVDQGELVITTKDGANRIWNFSCAPLGKLTDGRRVIISMATDITERKQAEKGVRFLHSVTQAIFESQNFHAALGVALQKLCEATGWDFGEAWVPKADGSVLECSPAWFSKCKRLEEFRRASEKLIFPPGTGLPGRVWVSQQPEWRPDVSAESNEIYLRTQIAQEAGLKAALGVPLLTPDGVLGVLVFYMFESQDEDQRLIELISASTELGLMIQRKQAEGEIRKALAKEKELTELKSRFISMTSHEFRTPLTTILSSAELLERYSYKWTEEKKLTHLHRIQKSVKYMAKLLDDVLIIGKAEAGKLEFNPVPLDLGNFCRSLVEELQLNNTNQYQLVFTTQGIGEQGIREVDHPPLPAKLPCMDEKLLRQILQNLLSNAIKYSPEGGTVEFTLQSLDELAVFQIRDRGIGIPTEDQQLLFETFHRATNVGTIPGTGLGLAIVKNCVDIHQGQIAVESEIGVGTTFIVTLPMYNLPVS